MKINIGSGDHYIDGFISIDIDPNLNPDIVLDLEKDRLPFEDSTVDEVMARNVLEHLGEGFFHCIKEIYRICKNGAIVSIYVPHHRHDTFFDDPTHRRPITVGTMELFSKERNQWCRENDFSDSRLGEVYDVDFKILEVTLVTDPKMKEVTGEQLEFFINHYFNVISEIRMKLEVIK